MLLYTIFRICFATVFIGLHAALMVGLLLERSWERRVRRLPPREKPLVSVIIAVYNERRRIENLLKSLCAQEYEPVELIFVDGGSQDGTVDFIRAFFGDTPRNRVTIVTLKENPGPNYKQYALAQGIERAAGSLFLFTDADCLVPEQWISSMAARMVDERVGLVIGPVAKIPQADSFFHRYQCFDHAVRYLYIAASAGLGAPGGGFGNNLIVRRSALEAIGGYAHVPYSPTEDAALIAQIRSQSRYAIHAALGTDTLVMTLGEKDWKALINQTLRWNNGGLFGPDRKTRLNFGFLMITIAMGVLALPLIPFLPSLWVLSAAVMFAMSMNTAATLLIFKDVLPYRGLAPLLLCLWTPIYFTFLTILGFCQVQFHWSGAGKKPHSL
ncbi:MAG: glycosyltransferase [Spirochaetaceae bacterium]|jgi:cellulose synthase/poly-beta-1,6-N-acetylglucosamine synthase-like glycosyltransferase|nr:glycosyltransferase [Spirochaetaceae bacterium]